MSELTQKLSRDYDVLTILCLKVCEAKLRSLVGDEKLSIHCENYGFVLHVDHATNDVSLFPGMSKVAAPCMHSLTLRNKKKSDYFRLNGSTALRRDVTAAT